MRQKNLNIMACVYCCQSTRYSHIKFVAGPLYNVSMTPGHEAASDSVRNMSTRLNDLKNLSFIFKGFCVLVCSFHLYLPISEYFQYKTAIRAAPLIPIEQKVPRLTLCFTIDSLVNRTRDVKFFDSDRRETFDLTSVTIDQLINLLPTNESVIEGCSVRQWSSRRMVRIDDAIGCSDHFRVDTSILLGQVCYTIKPIKENQAVYRFVSIASAGEERRVLYQFHLAHPLSESVKILLHVHFANDSLDDRHFNHEVQRKDSSHVLFSLGYNLWQITKLPPPYEGPCGDFLDGQCLSRCIAVHFESIWQVPVFLNVNDRNITLDEVREKYCRRKCLYDSCHRELTITIPSPPLASNDHFKTTLSVETAARPVNKIVYEERTTFSSLFIYCSSIICIWFGASAYGFLSLKRANRKALTTSANDTMKIVLARSRHLSDQLEQIIQAISQSGPLGYRIRDHLNRKNKCPTLPMNFWSCANLIYILIAYGLFLYELFCVSDRYFRYESRIQNNYKLSSSSIFLPNLAICMRIESKMGIKSIDPPRIHSFYSILNYADVRMNKTLGEIFNLYPKDDQVISQCRIRSSTSNQLQVIRSTNECTNSFSISKFFMDRLTCYRFSLKNTSTVENVKDTLIDNSILYSISLSRPFWSENAFKPVLFYDDYPFISRDLSGRVIHPNRNELYILSPTFHSYQLLPPPYDTNCDRDQSAAVCLQKCLIAQAAKMNRIPYSEINYSTLQLPFLTFTDLVANETAEMWKQITSQCDKCRRPKCNYNSTKTLISFPLASDEPLEWAVGTPKFPHSIAVAEAVWTLYSYFYCLFCVAAFWIGFSFSAIDPAQCLINRMREKSHHSYRKTFLQVKLIVDNCQRICRLIVANLSEFKTYFPKGFANSRRLNLRIKHSCNYNQLKRIICATGCTVHMIITCQSYFKYSTVMNTILSIESTTGNYGATQCAFIPELLNVTVDSLNLTTDAIFKQTPPVDEIITSCSYRLNEQNSKSSNISIMARKLVMVTESNASICRGHFEVQKFMSSNWMCYRVTPADIKIFKPPRTLNFIKFMFVLFFNSTISTEEIIYVVSTELPRVSQIWARTTEMGRSKDIWFKVGYLKFIEETLPFPYDLGEYVGHSYSICYSDCLQRSLRAIGLIPTESIVTEPSNSSRLVVASDYENEPIKLRLNKSQSKCDELCRGPLLNRVDIHNSYSITDITAAVKMPIPSGSASIWARRTDYNITRVVFHPKLILTQLLISLGSIFAIWFGLSIINLNPVIHFKVGYNQLEPADGEMAQQMCAKIDEVSTSFVTLLTVIKSVRLRAPLNLYKRVD